MKEERKKQEDLIRKQEKIVEELNKHVEEHEKAEKGKKAAEEKAAKEEKKESEKPIQKEGEVKKETPSGKNDMNATKHEEKREAVDDKTKINSEKIREEKAKDINQTPAVEKMEDKPKTEPNEERKGFQNAVKEQEPVRSEVKDIPNKELPKKYEVTSERVEKQPEPVKIVQKAKPQKNASLSSKPVEAQNEEPLKNIVPVSGLRQSETPKIGLEAAKTSLEQNVRGDI
ncbi:unnamed protein product [Cylicostephanus goldi]|uniref:Uncharacterized protein n=1 Tax=Cylicostephanus goldi TaxID=71465 RepID=A0A3P6RKC3_CYLGO|nr:unnamed protein product [Cylicostephanus goldi]